jgi:4-diphosphocytidyl-2-C-methyl-D-erythritol kinase
MQRQLTGRAPAKINLRLKVVGKREDGYHLLSMLNEKLKLFDLITVYSTGDLRRGGSPFDIKVICKDFPDLESGENLVARAAVRLAEEVGVSSPLVIEIQKKIPVGAGLGGGSSDAATCMMLLNKLWNLGLSRERLAEIGVSVGADVPFFMFEGPARVSGIGEHIDPSISLPKLWVLLANPSFEVSTAWAYRSLHLELTGAIKSDSFPSIFKSLRELAPFIENDLEGVVEGAYPCIGEMKTRMIQCGASISFMTGSGPTVVGLFETEAGRDNAFEVLSHSKWRLFATEN